MKNCPVCQHENPDEAKFCLECGSPFPEKPQPEEIILEVEENEPENGETEIIEEFDDLDEIEDIFGNRVEGLHEKPAEVIEEMEEPENLATEEVLSPSDASKVQNPQKRASAQEEKVWYFVENNESKGAFSQSQMKEFLDSGRINAKTYVWKPGFQDWQHLDSTELNALIPVQEEPEPAAPEPEVSHTEWYFVEDNEARGPYSEEQMVQMVKNQVLHGDDYVWNEDYVNWTPLAQTPLAAYIPVQQTPQPEPSVTDQKPLNTSGLLAHSLLTNLLLCVFTCGIYEYFWIYQEARDVNILARQRGLQPMMDPGMVVFLTIITCGLFGIYFFYKAQSLLNEIIYPGQNKSTEVILITALAVFIPVFAIVPMCIIQDNLNYVIEHS